MSQAGFVRAVETTEDKVAVDSDWRDYLTLLKPRVMSLVVFSGIAGLVVAPGEIHLVTAFIAVIAIALGAGASGAINMWYDSDIDELMQRTSKRPIPMGKVARAEALTLGIVIGSGAILIMSLMVNWLAAFLLAFTIGFYVFVYTIWLKRRTAHNIVIGGAAGALPPVIGWVAVTGDIGLLPFLLFSIIFVWTPPHFWALSLFRQDDYSRAGIPMLPVTKGSAVTRAYIFFYTMALAPLGALPWLIGEAGTLYGSSAFVLGGIFLYVAYLVWCHGDEEERLGSHKSAKRLFGFSIFYLFALLAVLMIDRVYLLTDHSVLLRI